MSMHETPPPYRSGWYLVGDDYRYHDGYAWATDSARSRSEARGLRRKAAMQWRVAVLLRLGFALLGALFFALGATAIADDATRGMWPALEVLGVTTLGGGVLCLALAKLSLRPGRSFSH
jgi:hypothetical protein